VKLSKSAIGRAVDQPSADIRFYLFYGPDEAQSRALAIRLLEALGATKFTLATSAIKSNPALIADEASAMSLFGGKRAIWIEPATRDIEDGVTALLEAPVVESPVVAIAAALQKSSGLLKLAEAAASALAYASYLPEGDEAARMVSDIGRRFGLKIAGSVAARIAEAAANDQAIVSQELQKFALFIDASPLAPRELEHAVIDELGTENAEGNALRLGDLALIGNIDELTAELDRIPPGSGIPAVRALQRRLLMLAPARARVDRGERVDAVMTSLGKALFWKDKPKIQAMLSKWRSADLSTIAERVGVLERSLIFSPAPEAEALGEELIAIARKARSL
jgi:DNA polymerase-3 subunit delta